MLRGIFKALSDLGRLVSGVLLRESRAKRSLTDGLSIPDQDPFTTGQTGLSEMATSDVLLAGPDPSLVQGIPC